MINFEYITAMARTGLVRTTMRVRMDAPWIVASFLGNEQKCGRSFVPGDAR